MVATPASLDTLRATIRQHTHADEAACVEYLLSHSRLTEIQREQIVNKGRALVTGCREDADNAGTLDVFMQEFSLSSKEGVALMCLAESLLRVPDADTADELIAEKVLSGDWGDHLGQSSSLFVNASTWGLMLTGRIVRLDSNITEDTGGWLKKLINRVGEPMVRTAVRQAMKIMGQQYVLGRDINEAIKRGQSENRSGTGFSFDMLGEGARTKADAARYFDAYLKAIQEIGAREKCDSVISTNGISVKLSALHPRYEFKQKARVIDELLPLVRQLAMEAKKYGLGFTIDAEEADRLELSLDIFQALASDPELSHWDGLGFVLQAYGKRSTWVADWLIALAHDTGTRLMVRLVKGAYWDSEIKYAQEQGYADYPVYTRKANTDLSYQVCAEKLLGAQEVIYPQFATHNAHTAALVLALAKNGNKQFEFQRLHGMGDLLHRQLAKDNCVVPVRVYAPVGAHRDLLPYLVRRLLENGANSSFVNRFMNQNVPVEQVITDVQYEVKKADSRRHSVIPLPENIYRAAGEARPYTHGLDLANPDVARALQEKVLSIADRQWRTGPIVGGEVDVEDGLAVVCPADTRRIIGFCRNASAEDVSRALNLADAAQPSWSALGGEARAILLERAAEIMLEQMPELIGLLCYEAGRTLDDGISEVREAADFLRYYALQARNRFEGAYKVLDPTGNVCESRLEGRGVFFCVSPWNFPLAIFTGQIAAALAAGNCVIAKPADPTPLIAAQAIGILHLTGVPTNVLHFMPGRGSVLGAILNTDSRVKGVAFTGSMEVAQTIQRTLVQRQGISRSQDIPVLVAETGGQNVMIVDSSALPEQVVDDVIRSAFLSAGQRCSALRVMYVQEEIADSVITMLKGAMDELRIGNPWQLETDVGPVIDDKAREGLLRHVENMKNEASLLHACQLPMESASGTFVAPHLFELASIDQLPGEVFGPILHVIRFNKSDINSVIKEINGTGFGLTLGVHSRIELFAKAVVKHTRVGNNYINRNMVGAVVGVNPFGGQGLSGTGPKAGGPHYLSRFAYKVSQVLEFKTVDAGPNILMGIPPVVRKARSANNMVFGSGAAAAEGVIAQLSNSYSSAEQNQLAWDLSGGKHRGAVLEKAASMLEVAHVPPETREAATVCQYYAQQARSRCDVPIILPGPTGETNQLSLHGRGIVYCVAAEGERFTDFAGQIAAALATGNAVIAQPSIEQLESAQLLISVLLEAGVPSSILYMTPCKQDFPEVREFVTANHRTAAIAWSGPLMEAIEMQRELVARGGAITPVIIEKGESDYMLRFAVEKTVTTNIVATGGNAMLLNLGG